MARSRHNFAFESLEAASLLIGCHSGDNPSDAEWDAWCGEALRLSERCAKPRVLIVTDGGHPTRWQLERIAEEGDQPLTAVLSAHARTRFVVSAMAFFHRRIRVFDPEQRDSALAYLGVDDVHYPALERCVVRLKTTLLRPAPKTVLRGARDLPRQTTSDTSPIEPRARFVATGFSGVIGTRRVGGRAS